MKYYLAQALLLALATSLILISSATKSSKPTPKKGVVKTPKSNHKTGSAANAGLAPPAAGKKALKLAAGINKENPEAAITLLNAFVDVYNKEAVAKLKEMFGVLEQVKSHLCGHKETGVVKDECTHCQPLDDKTHAEFKKILTEKLVEHKNKPATHDKKGQAKQDPKKEAEHVQHLKELAGHKEFADFAVCASHLTWNITEKAHKDVAKAEKAAHLKPVRQLNNLNKVWYQDKAQCEIAIKGISDLSSHMKNNHATITSHVTHKSGKGHEIHIVHHGEKPKDGHLSKSPPAHGLTDHAAKSAHPGPQVTNHHENPTTAHVAQSVHPPIHPDHHADSTVNSPTLHPDHHVDRSVHPPTNPDFKATNSNPALDSAAHSQLEDHKNISDFNLSDSPLSNYMENQNPPSNISITTSSDHIPETHHSLDVQNYNLREVQNHPSPSAFSLHSPVQKAQEAEKFEHLLQEDPSFSSGSDNNDSHKKEEGDYETLKKLADENAEKTEHIDHLTDRIEI
uniref:Uncharacterized protein n=1 Tax=Ditylenchus dipsaci TaxID=166011 RepID=A0A915D8J0_9BILA